MRPIPVEVPISPGVLWNRGLCRRIPPHFSTELVELISYLFVPNYVACTTTQDNHAAINMYLPEQVDFETRNKRVSGSLLSRFTVL
jgi:hypothetical protein